MTEACRRQGDPVAARLGAVSRVLGAAWLLTACGGDRGAAVASDTALAPRSDAGVASAPAAVGPAAPPVVDSAPTLPAAVAAFLAHVEAERAPDSTSVARGYATEGLRLLVAGIAESAARDTAASARVAPRLATLRSRVDSMQREAEPLARSRLATEAVGLASDVLQSLLDDGQPALTDRAAEMRQSAAAIRSDQPLSEQTEAVRRFFDRAAAALRRLVGVRTG